MRADAATGPDVRRGACYFLRDLRRRLFSGVASLGVRRRERRRAEERHSSDVRLMKLETVSGIADRTGILDRMVALEGERQAGEGEEDCSLH